MKKPSSPAARYFWISVIEPASLRVLAVPPAVLSDALVHLVNHGTYHRGQVVTHLRQLGKTAPSTDYLRYLDAVKA